MGAIEWLQASSGGEEREETIGNKHRDARWYQDYLPLQYLFTIFYYLQVDKYKTCVLKDNGYVSYQCNVLVEHLNVTVFAYS